MQHIFSMKIPGIGTSFAFIYMEGVAVSHGSEVIPVRFPRRVIIFSLALMAVLCFCACWQAQMTPAEVQRKVKDAFRPEYSQLAKHLRLSGSVRVEVTIAPDGKVAKAQKRQPDRNKPRRLLIIALNRPTNNRRQEDRTLIRVFP